MGIRNEEQYVQESIPHLNDEAIAVSLLIGDPCGCQAPDN